MSLYLKLLHGLPVPSTNTMGFARVAVRKMRWDAIVRIANGVLVVPFALDMMLCKMLLLGNSDAWI